MQFIINLLINGFAVFIAAYLLKGVYVDSFLTAVIVSVVLGITNFLIKPILVILTLPVTILTLGLFIFIINGLVVLLVAKIVPGFTVNSFLTAVIFSIVLSLTNWFLHFISK